MDIRKKYRPTERKARAGVRKHGLKLYDMFIGHDYCRFMFSSLVGPSTVKELVEGLIAVTGYSASELEFDADWLVVTLYP